MPPKFFRWHSMSEVNCDVAEKVGFEPTSHLRDYLISSQGRYDHFDTSPFAHLIL